MRRYPQHPCSRWLVAASAWRPTSSVVTTSVSDEFPDRLEGKARAPTERLYRHNRSSQFPTVRPALVRTSRPPRADPPRILLMCQTFRRPRGVLERAPGQP